MHTIDLSTINVDFCTGIYEGKNKPIGFHTSIKQQNLTKKIA